MTDRVSKIVSLFDELPSKEMRKLLRTLHDTYKERLNQEIQLKSTAFKKGDIVSFQHEETSFMGVIVKINPKTISLRTLEGVTVMAIPLYLSHVKNPPKNALELRTLLFPTFIININGKEIIFEDKDVRR